MLDGGEILSTRRHGTDSGLREDFTGGTGGEPGQAGGDSTPATGGYGQPGFAIKVESGVTLTKVVAGNIDGSEGTL